MGWWQVKVENLESNKLINVKFPNKKVAKLTLQTLGICQKKENDGSTFESVLVVINKF